MLPLSVGGPFNKERDLRMLYVVHNPTRLYLSCQSVAFDDTHRGRAIIIRLFRVLSTSLLTPLHCSHHTSLRSLTPTCRHHCRQRQIFDGVDDGSCLDLLPIRAKSCRPLHAAAALQSPVIPLWLARADAHPTSTRAR